MAQIAFKYGMSNTRIQDALAEGALRWQTGWAVFTHPVILCGLALYISSALAWFIVLGYIDVSLAYPFIAIGIVLTVVMGALFLDETLNTLRIAGTALVVTGLIIIARS